ncbi:CE1759 family FMN reductase [Naumannella halotolerans]|uniref:FMN reductase n=1 Tax=Naumannella halotolerans TaxID=993414 RepID=A0A4R7J587_9ACTN|nr:CE1759 family FMN reductase [Naumannella halotolerans]TDT32500.1 FMN reductase [Naumannella halotolerans]
MKLAVITAGVGSPSATKLLGDRLAEAFVVETGAQVSQVELRHLARDLAGHLVTRVPTPELSAAMEAVAAADAVIAVTPIYNGSFHGLFKLFIDALDQDTLADVPVLLAATGGTVRHSMAIQQTLVPLFFHLRARILPTTVFAATGDWGDAGSELPGRIERAARELADFVDGAPRRSRTDEFAVVPFEELLNR